MGPVLSRRIAFIYLNLLMRTNISAVVNIAVFEIPQ